MKSAVRLILIGGSAEDEAVLRGRLRSFHPDNVLERVGLERAAERLEAAPWDAVLADVELPGFELKDALSLVRSAGLESPVIAIGPAINEDAIARWLSEGATSWLAKPDFMWLAPVIARLEREARDQRAGRDTESRLRQATGGLIQLARSDRFRGDDLDGALAEVTRVAAEGLKVARAGVWLFEAEGLRCVSLYDAMTREHSGGTLLRFSEYPNYFAAIRNQQQLAAHNALTDPRTREFATGYFQQEGVGATLDTTVRLRGELKGVICLEHRGGPRRWTPDEEVFSGGLAQFASLALEGAERHRAEQQAVDSENRFSDLFKSSRDSIAIYRVQSDGRICLEDLNPEAQRLTGFRLEEVRGKAPSEFLAEGGAAFDDMFRRTVAERKPAFLDSDLVFPNGSRSLNISVMPLFDADGRAVRVATIARDVTEQRKLEMRLADSNKLEALGRLAGHIAHDFNNLLASVAGWASRLSTAVGPEEIRESSAQILQATFRGRELTRQVLAFGQRQRPTRKTFALKDLVEEAAKLLEPSVPRGVIMTVDAAGTSDVFADAGQLHQVVVNLVTNALQAMPSGGALTLRLSDGKVDREFAAEHPPLRPGNYRLLEVRDSGEGMTEATRRKIFEPFFTTRNPGKGTGLGLSVVHGVVQAHGGTVLVESELNKGTTFRVYLPAFEGVVEEDVTPGHGEHLMLVDDQPNIGRSSALVLEQLGYRTSVFVDPREALDAFQRAPERFDVVFTDQLMPGMTGQQLAHAVRLVRPGVPVILTSGGVSGLEPGDLEASGMRLLDKPWRVEDAVALLKEVLPKN